MVLFLFKNKECYNEKKMVKIKKTSFEKDVFSFDYRQTFLRLAILLSLTMVPSV